VLNDVIRDAIALAATITTDIQEPVEHWPWVGLDADERPKYADAPVVLGAFVEREPGVINMPSGEVIEYSHHIAFMGPVAAHGADGRKEPIDPRDKFVLADGTSSPVVRVKPALWDVTTHAGYAFEVWLGVNR